MAIERTVSNSNPKAAAAAVAAAKAANAPAAELTAAVNRVATSLGGVYFLTSLSNPTLDPFRCDSVDILYDVNALLLVICPMQALLVLSSYIF